MRLSSLQILDGILLDLALNKLGENKKLLQNCLDNIRKLTALDLESYQIIQGLIKKYPEIRSYVDSELHKIEDGILKELQISREEAIRNLDRLENIKI